MKRMRSPFGRRAFWHRYSLDVKSRLWVSVCSYAVSTVDRCQTGMNAPRGYPHIETFPNKTCSFAEVSGHPGVTPL